MLVGSPSSPIGGAMLLPDDPEVTRRVHILDTRVPATAVTPSQKSHGRRGCQVEGRRRGPPARGRASGAAGDVLVGGAGRRRDVRLPGRRRRVAAWRGLGVCSWVRLWCRL